ncbi:hypothetical protein RclHR1_10460006 [Rhizophagus clarus]|uniref:BTB domain-containing protein n=1 Tax=Rhizophagus clarus TaxID=94130 RepID=A0A2Z6Q673_9GLOM|nr:hypothetical protein RclHR1_10460006 [Rhizophagus clarus]
MTTFFKTKTNQNKPSVRGKSLENDLRALLNDERSFDISLKCSDGVTLRACKNILATRSDVFNNIIFNKSKAEIKNIIFTRINSTIMKVILEFLYTSNIKKVDLSVKEFIDMYYAASCFKLSELQKDIIEFTKKILKDGDKDLGKQLLSQYVEIFAIKSYNGMSKLLIDSVAKFRLNPLEDDSLSLLGLKYLLSKTFEIKVPFATTEFELFKYTLIKIKKLIIKGYLPTHDSTFNMDYEPIIVKGIQKQLKPLLPYFDLHRMDFMCIMNYIEPLNIFPSERMLDAYRCKIDENISAQENESRLIRGIPIFRWQAYHERIIELNYGFQVSKDGFTVQVNDNSIKSMIADMLIKGKGIYEWDIVIEKLHKTVWIGICDYDKTLEENVIIYIQKYHGWVLCSDGYIYHKKDCKRYGTELKEGDIITIHLNMTEKSVAFSINGEKHPIVSDWKITSKIIPVVSLRQGSKLRIQPHLNELS